MYYFGTRSQVPPSRSYQLKTEGRLGRVYRGSPLLKTRLTDRRPRPRLPAGLGRYHFAW